MCDSLKPPRLQKFCFHRCLCIGNKLQAEIFSRGWRIVEQMQQHIFQLMHLQNVNSFCWLMQFSCRIMPLVGVFIYFLIVNEIFFGPLTWFLWIFFFFVAVLHFHFFFWLVSWETSGFPWALGAGDSVCGAVDKWSLFGVTLSHSQAINFAAKQTAAFFHEPDCCKQRPGRINARMRALGGRRVHELRIGDQINSQL